MNRDMARRARSNCYRPPALERSAAQLATRGSFCCSFARTIVRQALWGNDFGALSLQRRHVRVANSPWQIGATAGRTTEAAIDLRWSLTRFLSEFES